VMHRHVAFAISWLAACTLAFHPLFVLSPAGATPSIRAGFIGPTPPIGCNDRRAPEAEFEDKT
ncbi:MAG: hypothetical protein ABGY05_12755, partial [Pseudomonadota bacterium]